MKLSALILTIVITGIVLYGCGHKDIGQHEKISFSEEGQKSIEFIGTRKIPWVDRTLNIPWYRLDADYNATETADFWQKITVPSGTKATYVGCYGQLEWYEWDDEGESILTGKGLDFLIPDEYYVPPGPGFVYVRRWLYSEKNSSSPMSFKFDRYYVFCLDHEPEEEWLTDSGEPGCDMDLILDHVIAIIEITPTFDCKSLPASSPLRLTEENLLTFQEIHSVIPDFEFEIVRKDDNRFEYLIPDGYGSLTVKPETIQKLLYTINTIIWKQEQSSHPLDRQAVMDSKIEYLDDKGARKKAVIQYETGTWYMEHPKNRYYSAEAPYLFYEVRDEARHAIDILIINREIEDNPGDVEAWSRRAYLYDRAGEMEKACFDFKHLCELEDCNDYSSWCLGYDSIGDEVFIDQELLEKIAVESKDAWVRRAAVENLKNQDLLSKIAVEDNSPEVRKYAVKNLNDQVLLAGIAVEDEDENIRNTAVKNLNDQVLLSRIAVEDNSWEVRESAVKKLSDHALLARIAVEDDDEDVRSIAVGNLKDQVLLSRIAVEDNSPEVRESAVKKLNDQALLARIAVTDKESTIRTAAAEHITDQGLLAKIAVEDSQEGVRSTAAEKLTDQTLLRKIALEDESPKVRRAAVKNLTDQPLLARIALTDDNAAVQKTAVYRVTDRALLWEMGMWIKPELTGQVTDQALLEKIVRESGDTDVRMAAVRNITNQDLLGKLALEDKEDIIRRISVQNLTNQALLSKIALEDLSFSIASTALERLTDQNLIAKVAMESDNVMVRNEAVARLTDQAVLARMGMWVDSDLTRKVTDQALLAKITLEGKDAGVREAAVGNLSDPELLAKIAVEDKDWFIRVAALRVMAGQRPDETTRKFIGQRAAKDESSQARDEMSRILQEKWPGIKE